MNRLFVDTSAWLAQANAKDRSHASVRETLSAFVGRLVTTNHVFDETVTLARARLGHPAAAALGELLLEPEVVDLVRAEPADESAAWELFLAREDQRYSFTDCVSFVLMRRLGLAVAAALDEDFLSEGFETVPGPSKRR